MATSLVQRFMPQLAIAPDAAPAAVAALF